MKKNNFIKKAQTIICVIIGIAMVLIINTITNANEFSNKDADIKEEIMIKGTVVKAEDVCGIIAENNIYVIPCDQVDGFNDKMVNVIGNITEEGDVQTIDSTSVQTIE